jgi:hypothetical protein
MSPTEYNDDNRFVLFRQERREGEAKNAPEYSGKVTINGIEYRLSGWLRKSKDGKLFLSGLVQPKEKVNEEQRDF